MNLDVIKKHPVFALCLGVTVLLLIGAVTGLFLSERLYARQFTMEIGLKQPL